MALPAGHRLAAQSVVAMEDFLCEPLVEVPTRDRLWYDFWTAAEAQIGATVRRWMR